jgi:hypothetical protein
VGRFPLLHDTVATTRLRNPEVCRAFDESQIGGAVANRSDYVLAGGDGQIHVGGGASLSDAACESIPREFHGASRLVFTAGMHRNPIIGIY